MRGQEAECVGGGGGAASESKKKATCVYNLQCSAPPNAKIFPTPMCV